MLEDPIIKKSLERGYKWQATRGSATGYGRTKKEAVSDLEETERFVRITNKEVKDENHLEPES